MPKVCCATLECKHNKDYKCRASSISLSDGHIHTVHQGYKHIHECRTYEKSESAKALEKELQGYFGAKEVGGDG